MKKEINHILEVQNLNVEFPIFGGILQREISAVHAVKDFNLKIQQGQTMAIVGESGSGKSTLGKAIINVLKLTAPEVRINGKILLQDGKSTKNILSLEKQELTKYRSNIQMIFQDPYSSLNPRMIVKDIIREPMDIQNTLSASEKDDKVLHLLNKVGLSKEQALRYPHEFSGGQRQRIGIARALATDPKIIIADEPVSALDVSIQAQVINLMMDLQEEFDLTILFIAHDLSVVKHISTKIAVMYLGELVEFGNTEDIFSNPQHDYTKTLLTSIPYPNPEGREKRKQERLSIK